jgi:outer membrane receptor for ferrienterochelin and colicin
MFLLLTSSILFSQNVTGVITGKIIDKISKQPLPGVNVLVVGTTLGAATDLEGNYTIRGLETGTYQIRASFVGFNSVTKTDVIVNSARPALANFELTESTIELEGVTVTSDFFEFDPTEVNSIKSFSYEEIRRAPGGFEDVVRALSVLPGVAQASAGRNDLVVRGGAPSENLFLVDGLVVPNINHFGTQGATGGPLSFINLDFVENTSFSTGGFSALYGDKLSSVLSIDLREARKDRIGGKALISATQFGLNLEGPISNNSNFIFSARRSYLDFIFNAAGFGFVPEYYDFLGKFNYDINSKNKLSFLFVAALDKVNFNNDDQEKRLDNAQILGSNQNQYVTGLTWRSLFDKGFFRVSLSRNFVDFDSSQRDTLLNPIFLNQSVEGENEIKADVVYKTSTASEINVGVSAKLINFKTDILFPQNFVTTFGETLPISSLNVDENFTKFAGFIQYSTSLFNRFRLNLGLRADYFDAIEDPLTISPRFSAAYMIDNLTTLSFSTGIYYQNPSYVWLAALESNKNLKPVKVNQYVLGIERKLREDIRLKVEGFYKDYSDYPTSTFRPYLVLANTGAGFGGASENFTSFGLEPLVSEGTGNSRGVELSIQKKSSTVPHYALVSLTYSESVFKGLDGIERPGAYDQRWIFNVTGGYIFNEKWEASLKFRFATGSPYTPFNNDGTQSLSNYLTERFVETHALDLRVDRRWDFNGWSLITYLDIQNIYNRQNQTDIRWDYNEQAPNTGSEIGVLPSIGVNIEF